MPGGYWNKLLRINLSTKKVTEEEFSQEDAQLFLGGSGLGTKIIYEELSKDSEPLGPENLLIFATGPFQGTGVPGSGKWSVITKSPQTGTFAVSTAGAEWGVKFKQTGYDAVIISGRSPYPVYIIIENDKVEIKTAHRIWGFDAVEAVGLIKKELQNDKVSVAAIGPAGEKLVAIACIVADMHSFAGRCGFGAVMGSKNLKAVVVNGTKQVPIYNKQELTNLNREMSNLLAQNTKETFREHGTSVLVGPAEAGGDLPIKYWAGDVWPRGAVKLDAVSYTKQLNAKPWPCRNCPIGCHRHINVTLPDGRLLDGAGAEYESLGMLGSCCLIDDLIAISEANDICNRLGIDTISAGAFVAFIMECYEKGLIKEELLQGLKPEWGSGKVLIELIKQIGNKEKLGSLFSGGIIPAAKYLGSEAERLAVHVKGLDLPAHDPRSFFSLAVNYATSTRGACHLRGFPHCGETGMILPEIGLEKASERFSMEGQAKLATIFQDYASALDSLVSCIFMQICGMSLTDTVKALNAVTGWNYSPQKLMETGERIFNMQRLINIRDGFDRESDVLPERCMEPGKEGFRAGKVLAEFTQCIEEYYELRDWDKQGIPRKQKIQSLKLR
ncbi:MAG: hypothetical protein VR72_13505 [Clostridiaceae bacterium BRH_c20a]|nr:MAG: hypothetical protein VR72_13505 [Clostridiaceae bacterium BRH_c20a]